MIHQCNAPRCASEYQDKLYGPKKRVHNPRPKSPGQPARYRCTVCGNDLTLGSGKEEAEEKKK